LIVTSNPGIRIIKVEDKELMVRVQEMPLTFCKLVPYLLNDLVDIKVYMNREKDPELFDKIETLAAQLGYYMGHWSLLHELPRSDK
jgi:hypothetical protein